MRYLCERIEKLKAVQIEVETYKIINSFSSCQSTDFFDLVTLERSPILGMLCCHH